MKKLCAALFILSAACAYSQEQQPTAADTLKSGSLITGREPNYLINVSIGPSFRTAKSAPVPNKAIADYMDDLKSGLAVDISAYWLKDNMSGYGLKVSNYTSTATIRDQELTHPNGTVEQGDASDDIGIFFIGPAGILFGRGFRANDQASLEMALGYIRLRNDARIVNESYKITGANFGVSTTLSYHFGFGKADRRLLIGPAISFTGGMLSKLKIEGNAYSDTILLPDDTRESLYRLDLSLSTRFTF